MTAVYLDRYRWQNQDILGLHIDNQSPYYAIYNFENALDSKLDELIDTVRKKSISLPQGAKKYPIFAQQSRIFCVGKNYLNHAQEMGGTIPIAPDIFTRTQESFVVDRDNIISPKENKTHDYEGELAVIIGRSGRHIAEKNAYKHIFGYSIANDGSIRDWQKRTSQFTLGKNWDASGAISNRIALPHKKLDAQNIQLKTLVNGQIRQTQSTSAMVFPIASIIHTISQALTLKTGDVILTGTPEGVGAGQNPPKFLQNNDTITIDIEKIGILENQLKTC